MAPTMPTLPDAASAQAREMLAGRASAAPGAFPGSGGTFPGSGGVFPGGGGMTPPVTGPSMFEAPASSRPVMPQTLGRSMPSLPNMTGGGMPNMSGAKFGRDTPLPSPAGSFGGMRGGRY